MGTPAGRHARQQSGYTAFIPNPLPPPFEWTSRLVSALSEADRLVGRLSGEGGRLPNPHLLLRPFLRREAVLSSKIEGTQATLGEILAREAGAVVERSPDDLLDVANYVAALEHGIKRLNKLPLSLRLIKEIHKRLMKGVRGDLATPGEFRRTQNWIGPPGSTPSNASYIPPPPEDLPGCLADWEEFLHETSIPPLVQVALAHYQFEAIHPFLDGNGRVGRLLTTLFLVERQILPTPLLYLSAFFEATRNTYYDRLKSVSTDGAWEDWLIYFLEGVARQCEDALSRAERINGLIAKWQIKTAGLSTNHPPRLIAMLAGNPFVTTNKAAEELGVHFTTAQRAIAKLKDLAIVKQVSKGRRDRVFCATRLLDILEEPPKLV